MGNSVVKKNNKTMPLPEEVAQWVAEPNRLLNMDSSVLSQIHFVGNRVQYTGTASYRKWFDTSISEFRLLVVLSNEPGSTGARIHEIMGLDLGAISRSLNKMEKQGLVISAANPRHPSYRCWYITEKGAKRHDQIHEMTNVREAAITKGFSKAEVFQLLSFLHRLSDNAAALSRITEYGGDIELQDE